MTNLADTIKAGYSDCVSYLINNKNYEVNYG